MPPINYRYLAVGEIVKEGDLVYSDTLCRWERTDVWGDGIKVKVKKQHFYCRRTVPKKTSAYYRKMARLRKKAELDLQGK